MTDTTDQFVDYLEVYEDDAGEWRWRGLAGNNEVVSTSGEGYGQRGYAEDAATRAHPDAELRTAD